MLTTSPRLRQTLCAGSWATLVPMDTSQQGKICSHVATRFRSLSLVCFILLKGQGRGGGGGGGGGRLHSLRKG